MEVIHSIFYDREDIDGYIVPYHAHSDFIQLGAELGIIGFLLYLGIFLIAGYFGFIIVFKSDLNNDRKRFVFLLLISLAVYFIDAVLNFSNCSSSSFSTMGINNGTDKLLLFRFKKLLTIKKIKQTNLFISIVNNSFDASFD